MSTPKPQAHEEQRIKEIMKVLVLTDCNVSYKQLLQEQTHYFEIILPQEIEKLKEKVGSVSTHESTKKNAEAEATEITDEATEITEVSKLRETIEKLVSENTRDLETIETTINKISQSKKKDLKTINAQETALATKAKLNKTRLQLAEDLKAVTLKYNNLPAVKELEEKKQKLNEYNTYKEKAANEAKALKPHIENVKNLISKERKEIEKIARLSPQTDASRKELQERQDRLNEWIPYLERLNSPDYSLLLHLEKIPKSLEEQLDTNKTYKANKNEALEQAEKAVTSAFTGKNKPGDLLSKVISSLTDPNPAEDTDARLNTSANLSKTQGGNPNANPVVYTAKMNKLQMNRTNRLHEAVKAGVVNSVQEKLITELSSTALKAGLSKTALEVAVKYSMGQLEQVRSEASEAQEKLETDCYMEGWKKELDANKKETGKLIYKTPGGDVVQMSDILKTPGGDVVQMSNIFQSRAPLEAAVKFCTAQLEQASPAAQNALEANCYTEGWEKEKETGKLIYKMPGGGVVQMSDILESTYNAYVDVAHGMDTGKRLVKKRSLAEIKAAEGRKSEIVTAALTEALEPKDPLETPAATSEISPPSEPQTEVPLPEPETPAKPVATPSKPEAVVEQKPEAVVEQKPVGAPEIEESKPPLKEPLEATPSKPEIPPIETPKQLPKERAKSVATPPKMVPLRRVPTPHPVAEAPHGLILVGWQHDRLAMLEKAKKAREESQVQSKPPTPPKPG